MDVPQESSYGISRSHGEQVDGAAHLARVMLTK